MKTLANHVPNKVNWHIPKGKKNCRICNICDHVAEREGCGAKKLIEYDYDTKTATVYHLGKHSCWLQLDIQKKNLVLCEKIRENNLCGPAKQVGINQIMQHIDAGDMDGAVAESEIWVDRRATHQQLRKVDPLHGRDHNSFDAVGIVKRMTDRKDPFYVYRIGNGNLDGGSDYVFKGSRKMAQIAIDMDQDGPDNILQMENAYFDAAHTRVYGFKTLGLFMIHPAMKQVLRLASMDLRSENAQDIGIFFTLFNEMLAQVKGEAGYKFNPRCFCADKGSANWKAVKKIYGRTISDNRLKGCQWHFKNDVRFHMTQVGPEVWDKFVDLCNGMCECTTVAQYNTYMQGLQNIAEKYPDIKAFIEYWELQKSHVFSPFLGQRIPWCQYVGTGERIKQTT